MAERSIAERLSDIESKMDFLIKKESNFVEELSHTDFMIFYQRIKDEADKENWVGYCIWLDEKFAKSLQHKVLYPDYDTGYWYPIGKTDKDAPIAFRKISYDYAIECYMAGDFRPKKRSDKNELFWFINKR